MLLIALLVCISGAAQTVQKIFGDGPMNINTKKVYWMNGTDTVFMIKSDSVSIRKPLTLIGTPLGTNTMNVLVKGTDSIVYQVPASSFGATTLYSGDGTLAGARAVSGGSNTLQLGTTGSKISTLTSNVSNAFVVNSDAKINLLGGIVFNQKRASDANYTVTATDLAVRLPSITADRTITIDFNIADTGKVLTIFNENSSAFKWNIGTATVVNSQGGGVTYFENNTNYILQYIGADGGASEWRILSVEGYSPTLVSSSGTVTMAYSIYPRVEYVATGTTATYTLPLGSSTKVGFLFSLKNRGSGAVTINSNGGGNDIYNTAATNTYSLAAGGSVYPLFDGTYFNVK